MPGLSCALQAPPTLRLLAAGRVGLSRWACSSPAARPSPSVNFSLFDIRLNFDCTILAAPTFSVMAEIAPKYQKKGKRWKGPKLNTNQLEVRLAAGRVTLNPATWGVCATSQAGPQVLTLGAGDSCLRVQGRLTPAFPQPSCAPRPTPSPPHTRTPSQVVQGLGELHGLLRDSAVWMALDHDTVFKLDTLCFGNLDGGAGTAAGVQRRLGADRCRGLKAVRLALDEAFFMAHALGVLHVHAPAAAADGAEQLDSDVCGPGLAVGVAGRPDAPQSCCR